MNENQPSSDLFAPQGFDSQVQPDFFTAEAEADAETAAAHSVLDQLLTDSRLYTQSKDYKDLLNFVVRLRNFAPFNAMLLQVQKPDMQYAASARDWLERFGRKPKEDARPLLILWPFGPVALVYDLTDMEGEPLPKHVYAFPAKGNMTPEKIRGFVARLHASRVKALPMTCHSAKPANCIPYLARVPTEPCWYVYAPWDDEREVFALRSSRLILVGKLTGTIFHDGSAGDEG